MSSFSEALAFFQKSSNKSNTSYKKNDNLNKNKVSENKNHLSKTDDKVKNKEKENNNKEIKHKNSTKKRINIPINDIIQNFNDNNNQNNMRKNTTFIENKGNNVINKNSINRKSIKEVTENNLKNNSNKTNINSSNKNETFEKFNTNDKKMTMNKTEYNIINNRSNDLKNCVSIFESKGKNNEIKENIKKESKENKNKEKEKNLTKNINSTEISEQSNKSNKKSNNTINIEDNKFDIRSMINKINNSSKQQNYNDDNIMRRSEILKHKPVYVKLQEKNGKNNQNNLENNDENEITKKMTYTNNKITMDTNSINQNNKSKTNITNKDINEKNKLNIKSNNEKNLNDKPDQIVNTDSNIQPSSNIDLSKEKNEIILSKKLIDNEVENDTFCFAFFISSFNIKNPKMIEKSDELVADCGHMFCSSLQAIVPEIYSRYPEKDTNDFEISDLGASICFPNGIKICFEKNEMHINGLKYYSSILTNQAGKRYFMFTYHLYYKYSYEEFMKNCIFGESFNKTLLKAMNIKYIYIPFCICLLSKYPYFNQIEKCLESLRFTITNHKSNIDEIYNLLIYLTKSIPIPQVGTKINFPLPYYPYLISINQPIYKDYLFLGDDPSIILEYFSVEEIITILRLLLFEQKILLIGNNYDILSKIIYNFYLLLYPMQWVHTIIPIMTEKMIKYLESFLPFFNGMHISLYELASGICSNIKENIFIFDINKHNFELNTFPSLNSKNVIKKINELLPSFPKNVEKNLNFGLGVAKAYLDKTNSRKKENEDNFGMNVKIKEVFIQAFIELFYDYKNYLTVIDGKPIFNIKAMLDKKPKSDSKFYKELTETQLFQVFIQNSSVNKKENIFFEEQLSIYENLKDKKEFKEEFINNYNITSEIKLNYIIPPDILEKFDKKNPKKIKAEEHKNLEEYKKSLKKLYLKYETYFKPKSILKINKIILHEKFNFDNSKIPTNINYYIIPNIKFNFEEEKRRKTIKRKSKKDNLKNINKKDNELTLEQKDEIRENITDVITKIFKNDEISDPDDSEKLVIDSLNNAYGRDLLTTSLYNNKNILHKTPFHFLKQLIISAINKVIATELNEKKRIYYTVRLFKCCDNFKKKTKTLAEAVYKKLGKVQILNDINFWKEYAKLYVEDNCGEITNKDDKWVNCLNRMKQIMVDMGFNNSTIYPILADIGKTNIEGKKFSEIMKEIVLSLKIYENNT